MYFGLSNSRGREAELDDRRVEVLRWFLKPISIVLQFNHERSNKRVHNCNSGYHDFLIWMLSFEIPK